MESKNFQPNSNVQRLAKQNALQKMYLLTEPAFKKVKQQIDSEKYLSLLDKELKNVLYNHKLPNYKKWLQYKQILAQYFNFRKFLEESKTYEDEMSTKKLLEMKKRISELEKLNANRNISDNLTSAIYQTESNIPNTAEKTSPIYQTESNIQKIAEKSTPQAGTSNNQSIHAIKGVTDIANKRKSMTPDKSERIKSVPRKKLDFVSGFPTSVQNESFIPIEPNNIDDITMHSAPAGEEEIFSRTNEHSFEKEIEDDLFNLNSVNEGENNKADDSSELHKELDNKIISNHTLRQRIEAAPISVQNKILINGKYPQRIYRIGYFNQEKEQDEELTVNAWDVILDKNVLKIYMPESGYKRYKNLTEDSLNSIRRFLLEVHKELNNYLLEYNEEKKSKIDVKNYSILDKDNFKIIRYKNNAVSVPNEIVDEILKKIKGGKLTAKEFKLMSKEMIEKYEYNLNRNEANQSFFDPLPRTNLQSPFPKLSNISGTAFISSTPKTNKRTKRKAPYHIKYDDSIILPKKLYTQDGKGISWKKI